MFFLRVKSVLVLAVTFAVSSVFADSDMRGLRLDPSFLYQHPESKNIKKMVSQVIESAQKSGVNTLFVYAYNSVYGSFYPTDYVHTSIENDYGKKNIFKEITEQAVKQNMKVVAVLPINSFKDVWSAQPDWRMKHRDGHDYQPLKDLYLLSAWHPDFKNWLDGFYADFLQKNPLVAGIEAVEPQVDYLWDQSSDYNKVATQEFNKRYPKSRTGDQDWLNFRAEGLTQLIAIMNKQAQKNQKKSYVVQTWPVDKNGQLMSIETVKNATGIDFDGMLNLPKDSKLDYLMGEFMWQQWAAEYGTKVFNPQWTRQAALDFISIVNKRAIPIVHTEITGFNGTHSQVDPKIEEFAESIESIADLGVGIDVYDFMQIKTQKAWPALSRWNEKRNLRQPASEPLNEIFF